MKPIYSLAAAALVSASVPHFTCAQDAATPAAPTIPTTQQPSTAVGDDYSSNDLATYKTADALWQYIDTWANKAPDIDPQLDDAAKKEAVDKFVGDERSRLVPASEEFLKRYPQEQHRWDVKMLQLILQNQGENADMSNVDKSLSEIAAATDAAPDTRKRARRMLLGVHLNSAMAGEGVTPALDGEMTTFENDFPDDPNGAQFVALRLQALGDDATPEQINDVLQKSAKSANTATAEAAKQQLALRNDPLDLKFTAVDGRKVDTSALRGKVVLLDFWATWCGPCVKEVPNVVATYKKYHDQGFEIVGISLDEDKGALEKFTKAKEMTWPQGFDGKGWESEIPRRFNITSIPAMWLLGKDGKVASFNAREDLDGTVAKLLKAEPSKPAAATLGSTQESGSRSSAVALQP